MTDESDTENSPFEEFIEPDSLPVFVEERDDLEYRIAPRFNHGKLRWAVRVNEESRVVYEDVAGLTEDAADRFGVDSMFREEVNNLRQFIHRKFPALPVQGNRRLVEYPLSDVAALEEEW